MADPSSSLTDWHNFDSRESQIVSFSDYPNDYASNGLDFSAEN